jgi:uncharacterized NAD(P)/FAD-binding protein YdhS
MPQRLNFARGSGEFRVAIVGMGATGVAAFVHLARALARRRIERSITVHCFESSDTLGRGLAYSTQEDCHRLNMRAATMSLFPEHPEDFVEWLATSDGDAAQGSTQNGGNTQHGSSRHQHYVPRHRFGEYLSARFAEAALLARRRGVNVVHHRAPVHALNRRGNAYWISTPEGRLECDAALLCLGYLPRRAKNAFEHNPQFIANPFDTARLDQISKDARVGILGSSLTAVDAVLALERRSIGGITCFARRRGLPKVQGAPTVHGTSTASTHGRSAFQEASAALGQGGSKPVMLRSCTPHGITHAALRAGGQLSLSDAFRLLRDELRDVPGAHELTHEAQNWDGYHVLSTLRRDVEAARAGNVPWYPVLDATGSVAPLLWRALSDASKREFLRDYESLWAMVRHCMPLPTAERLLGLVEAQTLDVRVGLQSVDTAAANTNTASAFELVCRTNRGTRRDTVDYLIDGRGAEVDITRVDSPLLDSLRGDGLLRACPHGGVDVDFDTCGLVDTYGQHTPGLFFVGPLTKGIHFYTNSFETQRDNAQRAVTAMLESQEPKRVRTAHAQWPQVQAAGGDAR